MFAQFKKYQGLVALLFALLISAVQGGVALAQGANPGVEVTNECFNSAVVITLSNEESTGAAHFQVSLDLKAPDLYVLIPKEVHRIEVLVAEDMDLRISVTADNGFTFSETVRWNCDRLAQPRAQVQTLCAEDGFKLLLFNNASEGDEGFYFFVHFSGQHETFKYHVAPGTSIEVPIPAMEDMRVVVTVSGDNFSTNYYVEKNCEGSALRVEQFCTREAAVVVHSNVSNQQHTHVLSIDGIDMPSIIMEPRQSVVFDLPINEDQTISVVLSVDGEVAEEVSITRNCLGVEFELKYDCPDTTATAWFTNTSTITKEFTFISSVVTKTVVSVEPGQTTILELPIEEAQEIKATVYVSVDAFAKTLSVTRQCEPLVSVEVDCEADDEKFHLHLRNYTKAGVYFQTFYGQDIVVSVMPPQSVTTLDFPLPKTTADTSVVQVRSPDMPNFYQTVAGCGDPTNLPGTDQPFAQGRLLLVWLRVGSEPASN